MTDMKKSRRPPLPITLALAMILLAEALFVSIWGTMLVPAGDAAGKIIWAATCGVAMAAVIGSITSWLAPDPSRAGFFVAATTMALVGSYCAFVCSWIDDKFGYFGGAEYSTMFITSGVIAAIFGGVVYGWALNSPDAARLRRRLGGAP